MKTLTLVFIFVLRFTVVADEISDQSMTYYGRIVQLNANRVKMLLGCSGDHTLEVKWQDIDMVQGISFDKSNCDASQHMHPFISGATAECKGASATLFFINFGGKSAIAENVKLEDGVLRLKLCKGAGEYSGPIGDVKGMSRAYYCLDDIKTSDFNLPASFTKKPFD